MFGFSIKGMIVIHKSRHGMGCTATSFAPKHELLMFATKGRHELCRPNGRQPDVWLMPVHAGNRDHPAQKPLARHEPAIAGSSAPGDLVLDPFCGVGSALVAA